MPEQDAPIAPDTSLPDSSGKVVADPSINVPAQTVPADNSERPEWLPEKFATAEDMAKSYGELEKKVGAPPEEKPADKPQAGLETISEAQTAEKVSATKDISFDDVATSFVQTGEVSEDQYKALQKQGLNKETADRLLGLEKTSFDNDVAAIYDSAGGQENYVTALKWAAENFSTADAAGFDAALGGDAYGRQLAVTDLMSRYKAAGAPAAETTQQAPEGQKANSGRITGAAAFSGDLTEAYQSRNEYLKDMNSWDYKNTQAKRDAVDARAKKSGFL